MGKNLNRSQKFSGSGIGEKIFAAESFTDIKIRRSSCYWERNKLSLSSVQLSLWKL